MAEVARAPQADRSVARDLARLLAFWRTVPEQADEWPDWDDYSRLSFVTDWTIDRERLDRVSTAAEAGLLDERQQRDWHELRALIETHRTTVEWMLGGPI
jgi:hypothetical protein